MNTHIASTPVSDAYFSKKNIDDLQKSICFLVHKYSNITISPQSEGNLYLVMRNTFEFTHLPDYEHDVAKMVCVLNKRVLYAAVKNVLQNMEGQSQYLHMKDQWKEPKIEMPQYVGNKGLKSRPANNFM